MKAEVIETKRKPSLWTVKAGGRYQASFAGPTAKDNAIKYAAKRFAEFIVVERPDGGGPGVCRRKVASGRWRRPGTSQSVRCEWR